MDSQIRQNIVQGIIVEAGMEVCKLRVEEATDDVRSMTTRKYNCKSHSAHRVEELAVHI